MCIRDSLLASYAASFAVRLARFVLCCFLYTVIAGSFAVTFIASPRLYFFHAKNLNKFMDHRNIDFYTLFSRQFYKYMAGVHGEFCLLYTSSCSCIGSARKRRTRPEKTPHGATCRPRPIPTVTKAAAFFILSSTFQERLSLSFPRTRKPGKTTSNTAWGAREALPMTKIIPIWN